MSARTNPLPPPSASVLRMAAPLVISFWMRSLFTFVDTIYASTLGDSSVAAIGLSIPFEFLMIAVWVGLSTGLTSNLARAMGGGEGAKLDQYLRTAWRMVLAMVPVFAAIGAGCWLFAGTIAPDPKVAREFAIYGAVLIGGSAFSTFWSVIPDSIVKAHHDTRSTMWAGIWSNLINVGLNTLFTFVFHWGILGIALSTVIGRFGGLAYALRKASLHETARKARGADTAPDLDPYPYRSILALSFPAALTYGLIASETGILNGLLSHLDHATEAIAAYAIHYRVLQFVMMPAIATAVAMLPYTARLYGARDFAGIRRGLREAHLAGIAYMILAAPILYVCAGPLARALTHAEATREFAAFGVRIVPIAGLASLSVFLCRPAFEGLGRGRPGLVIAILRYVVLAAPGAWAGIRIAGHFGYPGVYGLLFGLAAAAALSSAVFLIWTHLALAQAASGIPARPPGAGVADLGLGEPEEGVRTSPR